MADKESDPLKCSLFNMIIDHLIRPLLEQEGLKLRQNHQIHGL